MHIETFIFTPNSSNWNKILPWNNFHVRVYTTVVDLLRTITPFFVFRFLDPHVVQGNKLTVETETMTFIPGVW